MIRVVVLASALAVRVGLRALLAADRSIEVIAEASNLSSLGDFAEGIDLLVVESDSFSSREIKKRYQDFDPLPAVLLLSDDIQTARQLTRLPLRAWGLIPLDASEEELVAAVHSLYEGLLVGDPMLMQPLFGPPIMVNDDDTIIIEELTARETEVLQWVARGLANKQIAKELGISGHTVKFHISSIFVKLGVNSRTEAVSSGARLGLIVL